MFKFKAENLGAAGRIDGDNIELDLQGPDGSLTLTMPLDMLDVLVGGLTAARDAARSAGVKQGDKVPIRQPQTFSVANPPENPTGVMIAFDKSLPTRSAYLLNSTTARGIGRQLIEHARLGEQAHTRQKVKPEGQTDETASS